MVFITFQITMRNLAEATSSKQAAHRYGRNIAASLSEVLGNRLYIYCITV